MEAKSEAVRPQFGIQLGWLSIGNAAAHRRVVLNLRNLTVRGFRIFPIGWWYARDQIIQTPTLDTGCVTVCIDRDMPELSASFQVRWKIYLGCMTVFQSCSMVTALTVQTYLGYKYNALLRVSVQKQSISSLSRAVRW